MANSVLAVYPGTFDPMTLGHEDVVRRACQLFDRVIVAVAGGYHKKALFSLEDRIEMARESVKRYPQVTVESFSGLVRPARGDRLLLRIPACRHEPGADAGRGNRLPHAG